MDVVTGLDQSWSSILELLRTVDDSEWSKPTPCSLWSVHDLAAHLGAVEGGFQGFPQPDPPADWNSDAGGIDMWTERGVVARRDWSPSQVIDEVERAADAQLTRFRSLDDAGWDENTMGPLGETTMRGLADIRLLDVYVHLLDLRAGLGRPLDAEKEPEALAGAVERVTTLAPWGAVKKARLADGSRVTLDISGPGGRTVDVVVDGGRGRLAEPDGAADRVEGTSAAWLLVVTGRESVAEQAGGLLTTGDAARQLVDRYRFFG